MGENKTERESQNIGKRRRRTNISISPYHRGKEVPTGTANRILKQAGLK
jgi:predicted RNA binding protein YcfA (HicA-like mRNA interferase family)